MGVPLCGAYHANIDELLIETQMDGVVITPFFLSTQPLLRYRLGDYVDWWRMAFLRAG
jgi:phenylacetate-coenzyme A ligase PaaK-like adenylate-forming protein